METIDNTARDLADMFMANARKQFAFGFFWALAMAEGCSREDAEQWIVEGLKEFNAIEGGASLYGLPKDNLVAFEKAWSELIKE